MSLSEQQWCPASVQVTVQQARGLRAKGKSGTNDAYAVMQVGKEKFQTSVVEKSVAPVWKEEAAFDLPPQGGGGGAERSTLHVHVLHRALVGPDKLLGQAVINLLLLSEDRTRNKTEWFKLLDKTGKPDKDRGEVLVDIQFMRNNMTASMCDLSAAGKSKSRMGKFKDKVRGKKKESDAASNMVPSFSQVLTDSEEEGNGDGEGKSEKKKKHKMKSLFSPKSNLQKNMSQSMSVLPGKNSPLSGSQSSGLNVEPSEGKKKFKFMIHKRSGSSDSKDSSSSHQKLGTAEQSNLCINGSHVYCEEPPPRTLRIGSNYSLASSGHGSMDEVPESSPPSVDSLRAVRQYSPWTEEEEEMAEVENVKEEEENNRVEQERRRKEEEENKTKEEKLKKEEEERTRREEEERKLKEEEERVRRQEEERERLAMEKKRLEEEERKKIKEEKLKKEEEERIRREEEEKKQQEEEERVRREEERERLAEEKRRREEQEMKRIEEKRQREEEERRKEEEERVRREEEERERLAEETRRLEEQERRQREEEERIRMEEERAQEERRRREEEEREEKRRLEEKERQREEKERIRMEEERVQEMRRQEEKEREEKRRLEEKERRQREEEERIRMEEKRAQEERRRQEDEERRIQEEKVRKEEEERIRREEERAEEEERMRRQEEEREEKRRLEEQERRQREEEEIRKKEEERRQKEEEEEEKARREKEEFERLVEEERKRIEAEERMRREEEERMRVEEERKRRLEEEEKRRLEEQERRRIEEEERMQREEEERIGKEEEERARKEKEEYERLLEEKRRQEEQERRRREVEEKAEKERKEEEAKKLEKERLMREAEEQKKKKEVKTQNAPGNKPKVPAEVTSTNPFDEDFSNNPSEEIPDSRVPSAGSSVGSKLISTDEKDPTSTQRERRLAPQPPGRNQAERASQREQDASTRHLAQTNNKSKDKDIKTVSVLPQRSVQMITPLSRSTADAKNSPNSTTKGASNTVKHSKGPAPQKPPPGGIISHECNSEAKQAPIVYGLNPFDDDEDESAARDDTGNTSSVLWPPAAEKEAVSQAKLKSTKTRAPPVPTKKDTASINQNTEENHATGDPGVTVPDNGPCDHESKAVKPVHVQEAPLQESQSVTVQTAVEETGGKKEGPPVTSRRLQPVKPLNPADQQSVMAVQGEKDNKPTEILCEVQEKTKLNDTGLKGPYSQLTQEELIALVHKQENQLSERDKKISELELYIDNLLVRVMEEKPSILMSLNAMKKAA